MADQQEKQQINPYLIVLLALLGGGASDVGTNLLLPQPPMHEHNDIKIELKTLNDKIDKFVEISNTNKSDINILKYRMETCDQLRRK